MSKALRKSDYPKWHVHILLTAKDMLLQEERMEGARRELLDCDVPGTDRRCYIYVLKNRSVVSDMLSSWLERII